MRRCLRKRCGEVWLSKIKKCVSGGETRQDSVYCGVRELKTGADFVLIHDGVRPLVDDKILARCVEAVVKFEAACCALPCADTIKLSLDGEIIDETLNRKNLASPNSSSFSDFPDLGSPGES